MREPRSLCFFLVWIQTIVLTFYRHGQFLAAARIRRNTQETNDEFFCNICGVGGFITNPGGIISTDQSFGTCQAVQDNQQTLGVATCEVFQQSSLIAAECGCVNAEQVCPICGVDGVIGNPDGIVNSVGVSGTCRVLDNNQRTIPDCPAIQNSAAVTTACGCTNPTQSCPVCPNNIFITNPNAVISAEGIVGTCGFVNASQRISESQCAALQVQASTICGCSDESPAPTSSPRPLAKVAKVAVATAVVKRIADNRASASKKSGGSAFKKSGGSAFKKLGGSSKRNTSKSDKSRGGKKRSRRREEALSLPDDTALYREESAVKGGQRSSERALKGSGNGVRSAHQLRTEIRGAE